jgi:hypothetical protein
VDRFDVGGGVESEGDASLVGDDDDAEAGAVEAGYGLGHPGVEMEFFGRGDVATFGQLSIEHAVAVEEYGA